MYYILLIGMMIPFQTIMLPLYFTLKSMGMLNSLTGISLLMIGTGEGFAIMMMRSFFISIPDSMIEAARLDGCSELKVLMKVILPNTFPAWTSLIVITAMGAWNNLLAPMMYIFEQNKYPIPYALYAFQSAHTTDYQLLAAGMMISMVPIVIVYVAFQSSFQNGLMAGAVNKFLHFLNKVALQNPCFLAYYGIRKHGLFSLWKRRISSKRSIRLWA